MRRLAIGALALALMGTWGGTALAQFEQPIGDIYLSFSNTALPDKGLDGRYKTAVPFVQFNFYIMYHVDFGEAPYNDAARNLTDGTTAWEASVSVPAALTVTTRTLPSGHTNFAQGADNFIVGTGGQCVFGSTTPFALVSYSALLLSATNDLTMTLGAATPSSFSPAQPGFLGCPATSGRLFPVKARYTGHWIKLNCTTAPCGVLAENEQTWGALKSTFSQE